MSKIEVAATPTAANKQVFVVDSKGLPLLHKSVFSRFCRCGANVTLGLVTDAGYDAALAVWNSKHIGKGHESISHHEWLNDRLN